MEKKVIAQSAVVPFRKGQNGAEVLLVTSRDTGRWVLPKGNIKNGMSPALSAAEEAFEEAGVLGKVHSPSVGTYKYVKQDVGGGTPCLVKVFLMTVEQIKSNWPEKSQRRRKWVSASKAARLVNERKLGLLIRKVSTKFVS
ncbi:NUDIX hydrolase [Magnetospira thiophila]